MRLTRDQLAEFLPNPRAVKLFEQLTLAVGTEIPGAIDVIELLLAAHIASHAEHGASAEVVGTNNVQTLTDKTLTLPIIAQISNTGVLTLPTATDTLIGKATVDTLTNKTFDTAGLGNILKINSVTVSTVTGTGSVVLSDSPALTTPNIGAATGTSLSVSGQLISTVSVGTPPLVVTSTTPVANLSIGGNAATATSAGSSTSAINLTGGVAGSIPYQTGASSTTFLASGSGVLVGGAAPSYSTAPTLIGTNFSGTAAGLTAGNVTTNANLTGPITSSGNATSVASQTGTGTTFVMSAAPTISGSAQFTGSIFNAQGSAAAPSYTFSGTHFTTGFYQTNTPAIGVAISGAAAGTFQNTGWNGAVVGTTISASGLRTYTVPDNVSASVPTVASSGTIAITTPIAFVSGVTTISTITAPAGLTNGGQITIIPTGIFATNTAGNIALASTAVVSKALIMTYSASTAKWYPSY